MCNQDPQNAHQAYIGQYHPLQYLERCIHFVTILLGLLFEDRQTQSKSDEWVQDFSDTISLMLSNLSSTLPDDTRIKIQGKIQSQPDHRIKHSSF